VLVVFALVGDTRSQGRDGDLAALSAESSESFVFALELTGEIVAEYTECFGLGSGNRIEESVVETDGEAVVRKTPGALEWHNITLRRVGPSDAEVWSWRKAMEDGRLSDAVRDGAIVMFEPGAPQPHARWDFTGGWAASLAIEGSVEELTIVHAGLTRVGASTHTPAHTGR